MAVPVLVLTSSKGFGALLQYHLESTGRYKVIMAHSAAEGLERAALGAIPICILDIDRRAASSLGLLKQLRVLLPETRLVIVLPKEELDSFPAGELLLHSFLTRPFHLPDLLDTLEDVLKGHRKLPAASGVEKKISLEGEKGYQLEQQNLTPGLSWLQDVNRAAQYLARLSLASSAQAALIVHQGKLWAYAGQLPQQAVEELVQVVVRYRARNGGGDLARFVRLDALQSDHMLYATDLGEQMILALVFDGETPFSKIRSQAARLARALASPPGAEEEAAFAAGPLESSDGDSSEAERMIAAHIPTLFEDVPPPIVSEAPGIGGIADQGGSDAETGSQPSQPADEELAATTPGEKVETVSNPCEGLQPDSPAPVSALEPDEIDILQPISPALCDLNLACVLIPRLPQHCLAGDLAASLKKWLPQICLAFGWRLELLSIQEDHLLWVVSLTPATSPGSLLRTIRKQTSLLIFADFPALRRENPSGDFWAPGYLITSSSQPPAQLVIQSFIQQARQHQGALKPIFRQN